MMARGWRMLRLAGVLMIVAAMDLTAAQIAFAQSVTAFDGTYNGVSSTANGPSQHCVSRVSVPELLTIRNGIVQFGEFQGTVTAVGDVMARNSIGRTFIGKLVGARIALSLTVLTEGAPCVISNVWQRP